LGSKEKNPLRVVKKKAGEIIEGWKAKRGSPSTKVSPYFWRGSKKGVSPQTGCKKKEGGHPAGRKRERKDSTRLRKDGPRPLHQVRSKRLLVCEISGGKCRPAAKKGGEKEKYGVHAADKKRDGRLEDHPKKNRKEKKDTHLAPRRRNGFKKEKQKREEEEKGREGREHFLTSGGDQPFVYEWGTIWKSAKAPPHVPQPKGGK